jgi:hypothetical protein
MVSVANGTEELDIETDDISDIVSKLFKHGCCIDLTIRTWQAKISAKNLLKDIGVENKAWSDNIITGGQIKFIDDNTRKSFHDHEVNARLLLDSLSLPFLGTRFITTASSYHLMENLNPLREEFTESVNAFLDKFEDVRNDYISRMAKSNPKYADVLEWHYPKIEDVQEKFEFKWFLHEISQPKILNDQELLFNQSILDEIYNSCLHLRSRLANALFKFISVIEADATVKSSSMKAIEKSIDNFSLLNFINDPIDKYLNELLEKLSMVKIIDRKDKNTRDGFKLLADMCLKAVNDKSSLNSSIENFIRGE